MTPGEVAQLIGGIGTPVAGIACAWLVFIQSRKNSQDSTSVSAKAVAVDEKEAGTAELAMAFEVFRGSLETLRIDLTRTQEELSQARGEIADLTRKVLTHSQIRAQMLAHIIQLEGLVPEPPGAPARPIWD